MPTSAICYFPVDSGTATELRSYLETNCPISIEDGVVQIDGDLLDAAEVGLSFDYVLLLLSPDSTQLGWKRERWESILFQQAAQLRTKIVYVLIADCKFPAVLRKQAFFDLSSDFVAGRRALKRWMLSQLTTSERVPKLPNRTNHTADADIDSLEALADWPELTQTDDRDSALAFAYSRHTDFEAVVWLQCERRGRVGILGDLGYYLNLRLENGWEDNVEALTQYCADHRVLLVFENLNEHAFDLVNFGGKASIILVTSDEITPRRSAAELTKLFSAWKRNAEKCLAALGDVEAYLDSPEILEEESWPAACTLCSAAVGLLKDCGRFAEAYDLLARISSASQVRGDLAGLGQVEWETSWILEHWGRPVQIPGRLAAAISEPTQLSLFG